MKKYDLIIIGGGPAGTPVAVEYAKLNPEKKVLLVDKNGELGGECLFEGCIPSKIMQIISEGSKNWEEIKEFKTKILDKRSKAAKDNLPKNVELLKGKAKFFATHAIEIADEIYEFEKCVIGVGSKPNIPNYAGNGIDKIWTNVDFFSKMELPKSLSIIGTGAIAIEFTQILANLGVKINLFSRSNTILKKIDNDAKEFVLENLKNHPNINLIFEANIKEINYKDEFEIIYTQNNETKTLTCEKVLSAIGRSANISNLNLDKAEIEYDKHGIIVNKHLQTSNKNIYANGDVVSGFPAFAHTAFYGSHIIAQNLFLNHNFFEIDFDKNSWVLFSTPNIATSGIDENTAKKRELDVIIDKYDFSVDAKAQITKTDNGFLKFIVDKKSLQIIGVVIAHKEANQIAGEAALIISNKTTLKDLLSTIHPHPTLSESFSNLAKQMMGKIILEKLKNPLVHTILEIERNL